MIKHGQDGSMRCLQREDECEEKGNSERRKDDAVDWFFLEGEIACNFRGQIDASFNIHD